MEMVVELVASRRNSLPWECIIRGGLVLAIIGVLCIGSRSDAKDKPAKTAGDIVNPGTGEHILGSNARECGRNAKDTAVKLGEETGILAYIWEKDIVNALVIPNGTAPDIAEWPVIIEFEPETGVETVPDIEELPFAEPPYIEEPYIEEDEQAAGFWPVEEEVSAIEEDGTKAIPPVSAPDSTDEGAAEDVGDGGGEAGAEEFEMRELAGFLIDEEGYIAGVTERVDLTDGILILVRDTECIGIREGALSELAGCVGEIYIPANIREIEPGALDVFESLAYIEAAEDNPGYYSENGILYPKE